MNELFLVETGDRAAEISGARFCIISNCLDKNGGPRTPSLFWKHSDFFKKPTE